jgi:hypothetical protein
MTHFHFDAIEGTWSVAAENNYVLNPGFEADRVSQNSLAGWTNSSSVSGGDPNGNASGARTGNFCMQQQYSSAYKATMYQEISTIPDGTYTLTAWVQSSGGQDVCKVFISDFGNDEKNFDISTDISQWTEIQIEDIAITGGLCRVGIMSDAQANNWCKVDDISLVNADPTGSSTRISSHTTTTSPVAHTFRMVIDRTTTFGRPPLNMYSLSGRRIGAVQSGTNRVGIPELYPVVIRKKDIRIEQ